MSLTTAEGLVVRWVREGEPFGGADESGRRYGRTCRETGWYVIESRGDGLAPGRLSLCPVSGPHALQEFAAEAMYQLAEVAS